MFRNRHHEINAKAPADILFLLLFRSLSVALSIDRASALLSADKDATYCTDCTAPYQARMKAEHRCRHPETQFVTIDFVRKT